MQGNKAAQNEPREVGSESGHQLQDTGSAVIKTFLSAQETEEAAQPAPAEAFAVEIIAGSAPPRRADLGDAAALAQQAPAAMASMVLMTESGTGGAAWDADEPGNFGMVRCRTP